MDIGIEAKCPYCGHDKCDAEHLFWQFPEMSKLRQEATDCIQKITKTTLGHSVWRGTKLQNVLDNNAFRNCGICPGELEWVHTINGMAESDAVGAPNMSDDPSDNDDGNWEMHDGNYYRKVYTDGSAIRPNSRTLARAGWGVFYGRNSTRNAAYKLKGAIQNSYRAEVRAALHAVGGAKENTVIISDCKSVVNTLRNILDKQALLKNLADADLWHQIQQLVGGNEQYYRVRWIPSHMDDPEIKRRKIEKYPHMEILDFDVAGNKEADALASAGANAHPVSAQWVMLEQELQAITEAAQFMYVQIWQKFCQDHHDGKSDAQSDQQEDQVLFSSDYAGYVEVEEDPFELMQHQDMRKDWEFQCEQEAARQMDAHQGDTAYSKNRISGEGEGGVPPPQKPAFQQFAKFDGK